MPLLSLTSEGVLMSEENEKDVLDTIKKNINRWYSYFNINIQNYKEDVKFVHGEQWTKSETQEHKRLEKATFTINKLYPYVKQIIGEQRQSTPDLEIRALEEGADQKGVDVRAGIIRNISYSSRTDIVYQTAFSCALKGGFGAFRILTEYEGSKSFDQCIKYEAIPDPTLCFWDPASEKTDRSDGMFCGCYQLVSKDKFTEMYPEVDIDKIHETALSSPYSRSDFSWMKDENTITVVDYYEKEYFTRELGLLNNGETIETKDFDDYKKAYDQEMQGEGVAHEPLEIVRRRTSEDYKIMYYRAVGTEILEATEWPCKYLPIVFLAGDCAYYEGKEWTISLIRYAKDPQKFLNYLKSSIAKGILVMRREQFIGSEENIPDNPKLKKMWQNPSLVQGMLIARRDTAGQLPQKLPPTELSQSELQQYQVAELDIQNILGMYESMKGQQGNEISGVAIANKIRQGNTTNFVYFDNLIRAIEHGGRIVLGLLPNVYDSDRVVPITDRSGKTSVKRINYQDEVGEKVNDITEGAYDIEVKAGAPFGMQKQEQFANIMQLVQAVPGYGQLTVDKLAALLDVENSTELVERARFMLPPALVAQEEGEPPPQPQMDPMQQAMLQVEQQKVQAQGMKAHADQVEAQADMMKARADVEAQQHNMGATQIRSRAEIGKALLEYQKEMRKIEADEEKDKLERENTLMKQILQRLGI